MQTPEPTAAAGQPAMPPVLRTGLRLGALIWLCLLAAHLLAGCGGGDAEPDQANPHVNCALQPVVCK